MKMKKSVLLVMATALVVLFVPLTSQAVPPAPYRVGGTVTVNGVQLTQATAAGYSFMVTNLGGSLYTGTAGAASIDGDGLDGSNLYLIDIPMYDAADQPNGAQSSETAFICVYKDGVAQLVTSPASGQFLVGSSGGLATINVAVSVNTAPTADAGADQVVSETASLVSLDGSGSSDPEGPVAGYAWLQTGGPGVTLLNSGTVSPSFAPPNVGPAGAALTFSLTVTDAGGLTDSDTCTVTVNWVDAPPTANAGFDQTVGPGGVPVTLDGSGSYDDVGIVSYQWVQLGGAAVTLSNATAASPTFTAPADAPATLTFELTVTDTAAYTATDRCTVTVSDAPLTPPTADAGPDQMIAEGGATVTLDGGGSFDPDGTITAYLWVQTDGPDVILSDVTAVDPTFTAPDQGPATLTFELTVTDNDGLTDSDTCLVVVGQEDFETRTSLIFPYFASNANYWRGIAIFNPSAANGIINLVLHDMNDQTSSAILTLDAKATFVELLDNIAWAGEADINGRCYITGTMSFPGGRGFAMFGNSSGDSMGYIVENFVAATTPADLYFPYFPASKNFWRGIALLNSGTSGGAINLTLHDTTGQAATAGIFLGAGQMFVGLLEEIDWTGPADVSGRCNIIADMNFSGAWGFAMFSDDAGNSLGYVVK